MVNGYNSGTFDLRFPTKTLQSSASGSAEPARDATRMIETNMDQARVSRDDRFDRILREYGPALSRVAFGYEKVAGIREELLQEMALAIWQALPYFRGECSERTFIYRIAHNRGLSHTYKRRPSDQPLEELPEPAEPRDPRPHPEEQVVETRRRENLRSAIQTLAMVHRQVLMLTLEELSQAEIAEVLGITENNVAVRLNRAKKALKEILEQRP
jgi:RNA polymerase sigma-70 factor, ECF subfamily